MRHNMKDLPNILWIFSDQHRAQAMSCAGDINIETTNLDRLANDGIRFSNAFANTPICSPSRACILTGKYATSHGVFALHVPPKPNQKMLQQELKKLGYYTSYYGKWHLSGGAAPSHFVSPYFRPDWDEWRAWENSNRPWNTEYAEGDFPLPIKKLEGYQTDALTDMTVDFIKIRAEKTNPWFHVMSVEPPHDPHNPPEEYIAQFCDKTFEYRKNVPLNYFDKSESKNNLIGYYAQIKNLDDNIGRILNTLEETNQIENTIIFYFSDHGEMMGSHNRAGKSRYEVESSKIPLIIRYPKKIPRGRVTEEYISTVDFLPTLLGMLNVEKPDYAEGEDYSDLIYGDTQKGADEVLLQFERNFYGIYDITSIYRTLINEDWMYTCFLNGDKKLYSIKNDEYQLENLIDTKKSLSNNLHNQLKTKLDEIGDDFFDRENDMIELS